MRRKAGIVAAWMGATALSVLIATAAVGAVRGRVTEGPQSVAAPPTLLEADAATTTTMSPPTTTSTTTTAPDPAPTTGGTGSSTTSTTTPDGTTSTTEATTTTPPPVQPQIRTYTAVGGSVTIEVSLGAMKLLGATPTAGFTVSEKEISPTRIEIEFRSSDHKSEIDARLDNGVLDVSVDEEPEDGD